jgi:hypothetical protein
MDAQREAVTSYVRSRGSIVAEYTDVESGRKSDATERKPWNVCGELPIRCCAAFFMGNSLSDPKDLLIPFIVTNLKSPDPMLLVNQLFHSGPWMIAC